MEEGPGIPIRIVTACECSAFTVRSDAGRSDFAGRHPAEPFNEEMLIQRIRNGEHDLFYELIRPYERRVYAAAFAILRNEADAEDVAQEAMLKAFKHIRQFRAEARFSTWLTQITINEARMWRRKATRQHYGADR